MSSDLQNGRALQQSILALSNEKWAKGLSRTYSESITVPLAVPLYYSPDKLIFFNVKG